VEYQILDRTSYKYFLGLETGDQLPDEQPVWAFRESITKTGLLTPTFSMSVFLVLFSQFNLF
jgi:hypothetical protein